VFCFEDVGVNDLNIVGFGELGLCNFSKGFVALDGDDLACFVGKSLGQRASAATDFEHNVAILDIRRINEQAHQIQVDKEMLAKPFFGRQAC
jgi:hypothetical protein